MEYVDYTELIITCEACGSVTKYTLKDESEADRIFQQFECENGCGRNLYSFITLGTLKREGKSSDNATRQDQTREASSE